MTSPDRRRWRSLAGSWVVIGALLALGNVAYVTRNAFADPYDASRMVMLIAGPLIMAAQIALSAALVRAYRIQVRFWSVAAGGLTGLAVPALLFVLLAKFEPAQPSRWHQPVDAMVWTMLACSATLLGVGLVSGMAFGYDRGAER